MFRSGVATVLLWGAILLAASAILAPFVLPVTLYDNPFGNLAALAAAALLAIGAGIAAALSLLLGPEGYGAAAGWRTSVAMAICALGLLAVVNVGIGALLSNNTPLLASMAAALVVMLSGLVAVMQRWRASA